MTGGFMNMFNLSLQLTIAPAGFRSSIIVPMSQWNQPSPASGITWTGQSSVYMRSKRTEHAPLLIHGETVQHVNIRFLGIHITSDLAWFQNSSHLTRNAQQRLLSDWTGPLSSDKRCRNIKICTRLITFLHSYKIHLLSWRLVPPQQSEAHIYIV